MARVRRWTRWQCSSCNHVVDLGVLYKQKEAGELSAGAFELARAQCPNCGSPKSKKGEGESYQSVGSSAVVITDRSVLARTGRGANRECEFCGSENVVLDPSGERIVGCRNCGAGLEGQTGHLEEGERPTPPPRPAPVPFPRPRPVPELTDDWTPPPPQQGGGLKVILAALGGLGALALLIWLLVFLFGKHEGEARVTDTTWQMTHIVYQRQVNSESDWKSDMRSGPYDVSCHNKYKETVDCDHVTCNPHTVKTNPHGCNCHDEVDNSSCRDNEDGTEDCNTKEVCTDTCYDEKTEYDPCHPGGDEVYEDWCDYKYDTWPEFDRAVTGGQDKTPRPPTLEAHGSDQKIERTTVLAVRFTDARGTNGPWTLSPSSLSEYQRYDVGQRWTIDYNLAGQVWPKTLIDAR